jgi:hypothetical protein
MAKLDSIFKFRGTFGGMTLVRSRTYGEHLRMPRRADVNEPFKKMQVVSRSIITPRAQLIKNQVNPFLTSLFKDGTLWSRLLSFFHEQQATLGVANFEALRGFEINSKYPLNRILHSVSHIEQQHDTSVELSLSTLATRNFVKGKSDSYRLRLIALFVSEDHSMATSSSLTLPMIFKEEQVTQRATITIPEGTATLIVMLDCEYCYKGEPLPRMDARGMRVEMVVELKD